MEARAALQQQLRRSREHLWHIEQWLQRQLVEPGLRQTPGLEALIDGFRRSLPALDALPPGPSRRLLERLHTEHLLQLTRQAERFLELSHTVLQRFPASAIMQREMRHRTETFQETAAEVATEPEYLPDTDPRLLQEIWRLRHLWQRIIGEFRLLVANRFGVFADDPKAGMQARARNITPHLETLRSTLERLQSLPTPEEALYATPETRTLLAETAEGWHHHYQQVVTELNRDDWRRDLQFYKTALKPALATLQGDLDDLQLRLQEQAAEGIRRLGETARGLARGLFGLVLVLAAFMLATYLYLRVRVFKPIQETTRALRHEALGVASDPVALPKLRETRELVHAFAEMKREVQRRQRGLDHQAHHDALTQLPNRVLFKDRLEHAINLARRNNQVVALLFLDLDNFKQINDALGHLAGDELLIHVARRLTGLLRHTDTVARFGGDEFAILLENVEGKRQARNIATKILKVLSEPVVLRDQEYHLTASIGIAMAPYDDTQPDNLIRDADTAMYEAKRRGKNAYYFFSSELLQRATSQLRLEREVRGALDKRQFVFHYQPIVRTGDKKIHGVEALIRWKHDQGRLRYPGEFMDTLLSLDPRQEFMEPLLMQVDELQERCLRELQVPLRVSINMPATVLRNSSHHEQVLNTLRQRRHPDLLHVEITEDTLLEDLANARVLLNEIKRLGIPLVLDDFGTGQSSLNHLRSFPFDAIKVDREFIMNLHRNPDDTTLVRAITRLAHSFNMKVVAEGVENREQHQFLQSIGCDYVQGYFISKPISANRLFALLQHMRMRPKVVN